MNSRLAIIIPAYKIDFLEATLESIARQTCKDFKLYIGDDHSPYPIQQLVERYTDRIDIKYKRFDQNLGGDDLVGQWNRCIDLAAEEEWVWMFSDDDIMDENCVAAFYETLHLHPGRSLFHFNIRVIDGTGKTISKPASFPEHLKIDDFHLQRWKSRLESYVVEYVFAKADFVQRGGFQHFDYAWHTDEATWTKIGFPEGIRTINSACVNWRRSSSNITPNNHDLTIIKGKLGADIKFAAWIKSFYTRHELPFSNAHRFYLIKRFTHHLYTFRKALPDKEWKVYLKDQLNQLDCGPWYPLFWSYYNYLNRK